ncbi:MAG: 5'/3'-nucleotidase SurE [Candidatus Aminicenantaceae bacterium]
MNTDKPMILLTNDDGFFSEGLEILARALQDIAHVYIVAPDREKSAISLALSLHRPLRVKEVRKNIYAIDGTPADCVYMAVQKLLPRKPDLLISGPNPGPNLGQQDTAYSGTVAGALQGTFLQIPSVAFSILHDAEKNFHYEDAVKIALILIKKILKNPPKEGITLNINIPPPPIRGIKVVKLGQKRYNPEIIEKTDPRNRTYFWIGTGQPRAIGDENSDVKVIKEGYITVTPLHTDKTDYPSIENISFQNIFLSLDNEVI